MAEPTHYEVLGIPRSFLEDGRDLAPIIKTAYHRSLLRNHPDKAFNVRPGEPRVIGTAQNSSTFTVDQIGEAYAVLSDAKRRADYDKALKTARNSGSGDGDGDQARSGAGAAGFQTGIENVDLDDLQVDEAQGRWYRSCRCGNERGFSLGESDLEEAGDFGELIVGCQDCSLWLRIHFAVVVDEHSAAGQVPG